MQGASGSFQSKSCIAGVRFVFGLFCRGFEAIAGHVLGKLGGHEQLALFIELRTASKISFRKLCPCHGELLWSYSTYMRR